MKLKSLRQCFRIKKTNTGTVWVPKVSFSSMEQIRKQLNVDPSKIHVYTCDICGQFHTCRSK